MTPTAPLVWPTQNWPLSVLTKAQWTSWVQDGFLRIPNAIERPVATAAAAAIREFVGADAHNASSWYTNTLDIYEDVEPQTGLKPHHGPAGMVQMFHHKTLWAIRQHPRVHQIFADLWGTEQLYVTCDRAHFKPPQNEAFPAWYDPGAVHTGVHWDVDTRKSAWPIPYTMQAVVYLEETKADQGALRVVPGFHRRLEDWSATQPANRSAERPEGAAARELQAEAIPIEGEAGTLVVWHSALPHGPGPNVGAAPRVSAYVTMHPVDAAPFVGEGRPPDAPLGMNDAGTLAYLDEMQPHTPNEESGGGDDDADAVSSEPDHAEQAQQQQEQRQKSCAADGDDVPGMPRAAKERPRRQSRERRVERWRHRLPLLDEDPTEGELVRRPPGEEDGAPAELTALGERLVGLADWEYDSKKE